MRIEKNKNLDFAYNLFEKVFPISDIRPYDVIKNKIDNNEFELYVFNENDINIGAAIIIQTPKFIFIENLAVDPNFQNKGFGSEILMEIINCFDKRIVLEVEKDSEFSRRKRFYERNGFSVFEDDFYFLPQINDEVNENEMYLMSNEKIDDKDFKEIKKIIFTSIY